MQYVGSNLCRTVVLSQIDVSRIKSFYSFITKQSDEHPGKAYKIILAKPLKYDDFQKYLSSKQWVDECDFIDYKKPFRKTTTAFTRKLTSEEQLSHFKDTVEKSTAFGIDLSNLRSKTNGVYRVLYEIIQLQTVQSNNEKNNHQTIAVDLTAINIQKFVQQLVKSAKCPDVSDLSTTAEVDVMVKQIQKLQTINIMNLGVSPNLVRNTRHPFYPENLETPFSTLKGDSGRIPGITTPYLYLSFKFSHTALHLEDGSVASINVNIGPGNNLWWLFDENELPKIQSALTKEFKDSTSCPGLIRDKAYLVTCAWLQKHKIKYTFAIQKPGEIIITPANCIHQVVCLTDCVKHTVNFPDPRWFQLESANMAKCTGHRQRNGYKKWYHGGSKAIELDMLEIKNYWCNRLKPKKQRKVVTRNFKCRACSQTLATNIALQSHMKSFHSTTGTSTKMQKTSKRAPKVCGECNKILYSTSNLNRHMVSKHGAKPVKCRSTTKITSKSKTCEKCGKVLAHKNALRVHMQRIHEMPCVLFPCRYCHVFVAKQSSDLREHVQFKQCRALKKSI